MDYSQMKVVVLAGGKGMRFRPFSFVIPKPLMPIGENPILLHLISRFKGHGFGKFLVSTGYQAELIQAYFGNGERFGVDIKYFHEDKPLGTAGPLTLMRQEFNDDEYFFLINGDIYTEIDFRQMAEFAAASQSDVVVGVVEKVERSSFGVLDVQDGSVLGITEKPERRYLISSGIYMIRGRALKNIPHLEFFTMPGLMKSYISNGLKVAAYKLDRFWIGIENAENLEEVLRRIKGEQRGESSIGHLASP